MSGGDVRSRLLAPVLCALVVVVGAVPGQTVAAAPTLLIGHALKSAWRAAPDQPSEA